MGSLKKFGAIALAPLLAIAVSLAGCGGANSGETSQPADQPKTASQAPVKAPEPVDLTITHYISAANEQEFESFMQPLITKKYPHITVKWVEPKDYKSIDDFIVNKNVPDILISSIGAVVPLQEAKLALDLNPLVTKHKLDLNRFYPEALQAVKSYAQNGELYSLPYVMNFRALFYNKDLFDSFGVPYPKDNMTWKESMEVTKKVTRQLNGKDISGFGVPIFPEFANGLALAEIDAKTNKAVLNTDGWLRALQTYKQIYSIPGNKLTRTPAKDFLNADVAMITRFGASVLNQIDEATSKGLNLNWDITNMPHFEGMKGITTPSLSTYYISATSKHPDEAFEVIAYLASDPESQALKASLGRAPAAKFDGVEKVFGEKSAVLKGKNVASLFKMPDLNSPPPSQYSASVEVRKYAEQYVNGKLTDARTALRMAEEEANQKIAGELNGK
jgi:multiple sugar transport system substrate-binding protein